MTGDWFGARPSLKDIGFDVQVYLNDQYQKVLQGGLSSNGSGRNSASLDAILSLDMGKAKLIPEAEVLIHAQANWGAGVNPFVGALAQVNDDADGTIGLHVGQAWYRQHALDRRLTLTVGFLDFQTIVDRNAYANSEDKQFMHLALDNNPLLPLNIGLGAALNIRPTRWYTLTLGAGDAESVLYKPGFSTTFHDDAAFVGYLENEFSVAPQTARGALPGTYRVGVVYDPRDRAVLLRRHEHPRTRTDQYGYYVSVDQLILRESARDEQGLGVFGRYGYRDSRLNRTNTFWSGGLSYRGLIPGRDKDVLAFGFASQSSSSQYRHYRDDSAGSELVYELYYAVQVTPWWTITSDIEYVHRPGATSGIDDAIVAGVRMRWSF